MNKFFKSKTKKKESNIVPKKFKKTQVTSTEVMGSVIGKLTSNFRRVANENDNDGEDSEDKNQGIIEEHRKFRKEKNSIQYSKELASAPKIESIISSSLKKPMDSGEEFRRAEVEETLIHKQSKISITRGLDDKIVIARQTHTKERSFKFTKNYFNNDMENEHTSDKVSNTTTDLTINSTRNHNSNKLRTFKNATKIFDSSESDSTIVLTPRNKKKYKKLKNGPNSLPANKNGISQNQIKLYSSETQELETVKNLDPLSDRKSNTPIPSRFDKKLVNKKIESKIQDLVVNDSDSTVSLTPNSYDESQNMRFDIIESSVFDSDSTIFMTPPDGGNSDLSHFVKPIKKYVNRKKKINVTSDKSHEPPTKKTKNLPINSSQELEKKFFKVFKDEKLRTLGFSSQEIKKKFGEIFAQEEATQTDTSSQELKEKLEQILENEKSANSNKSPSIDELREQLTEIFREEVLSSQIEPPPALLTQELVDILEPSQNDNATIDTCSVNQSICLRAQPSDESIDSSFYSCVSDEANKETIVAETVVDEPSINEKSNTECLSSTDKWNLAVKKHKAAQKENNLKTNKKSSRSQDKSSEKSSEVIYKNKNFGLEKSLVVNEELEDTVEMEDNHNTQILDETLKLTSTPESAAYEVEFVDFNHREYTEESDEWTENSSVGKLIIDESTDEIIKETTEDLVIDQEDPLYVNNNEDPLVSVLECENQSNEQEYINPLTESIVPDSSLQNRSSMKEAKKDSSDNHLMELCSKREPFVLIERIDVTKFIKKKVAKVQKRGNSTKVVSNSSKARSSLKKKLNVAMPQVKSSNICLSKELRVRLERLPSDIYEYQLKINDKINPVESRGRINRKKNNSRKTANKSSNIEININKIVNNKTGGKTQMSLKEVRIVLTPIQWKTPQQFKNKQINSLNINRTLMSPPVSSSTSQLTLKSSDVTNSVKDNGSVKKTRSRAKLNSRINKNTDSSSRNRKMKSKFEAIKNKVNSTTNLNGYKDLKKELRVVLKRISTEDLGMWQKNDKINRSKNSRQSRKRSSLK